MRAADQAILTKVSVSIVFGTMDLGLKDICFYIGKIYHNTKIFLFITNDGYNSEASILKHKLMDGTTQHTINMERQLSLATVSLIHFVRFSLA